MRRLGFLFVALAVLACAACNGGSGGPYTVPVAGTPLPTTPPTAAPPGTSTVSFLVIVPPATAARKRPHVVLPSNATSVTFTIDSVNGTAYTGTPTTETLASTNSACQTVSNQLSCVFNLSAPVGTLIWTVTAYSGTTLLSEGNVSITTTSGGTFNAPITLSGTVAKIVVSVGTWIQGLSTTLPITVQAEDANGNTILGTYTSPITLTDADTNSPVATSITTSGSDSPAAGELLSSGDSATLNYNGGTMSSAATIGASASGVSSSNITTATFSPTGPSALSAAGTLTFGVTYYASGSAINVPATASPSPTSTSYPIAVATGGTLGTASNLVGVTGLFESPNGVIPLSAFATVYYAWTNVGSGMTMGLAGFSDLANTYVAYYSQLQGTGLTEICTAPYPQLLVVPLTSWNVYGGSGTCTTTFTDPAGDSDVYAYAANGSYTDTTTLKTTGSLWDYYPGMSGTQTVSVDAAGDLTYSINAADSGYTCSCVGETYGVGGLSVPAPSSGSSTLAVNWTPGSSTDGPIIPTPAPTSVPNPWLTAGAPNGMIPSPLFSDTVTDEGSVPALPAQCAVSATLLGSNPSLMKTQENITAADPMDTWLNFYETITIYHYYLNGLNEVCNEAVSTSDYFEDWGYGNNFSGGVTPPIWSFGTNVSGALAYYSGINPNWYSDYSDTYTYLTTSSVLQAAVRTRSITEALPTASRGLAMATYAGLRSRLMRPRVVRHTAKQSSYAWPHR